MRHTNTRARFLKHILLRTHFIPLIFYSHHAPSSPLSPSMTLSLSLSLSLSSIPDSKHTFFTNPSHYRYPFPPTRLPTGLTYLTDSLLINGFFVLVFHYMDYCLRLCRIKLIFLSVLLTRK